jgi:hypothetical protein
MLVTNGGKNWWRSLALMPGSESRPLGREASRRRAAARPEVQTGRAEARLAEGERSSMGSPQVPDQLKKAPTVALRSFFAGIGKILLAGDRPQASSAGRPRHAAPGRRGLRTAATAQAAKRQRSLDETGNVRLLAAEELAGGVVLSPEGPGSGPKVSSAPSVGRATISPAPTQPLTGNVPVGASLVVHELPVPGLSTMSVAAIRARLRTLDVDQLQALLVHEHKNAGRAEVIGMIERRIEKIESGA